MKKCSKVLVLTICMLTVGLVAMPAHADTTYHYSFVGEDNSGDTVAFQLSTTALLSQNVNYAYNTISLDYCSNCAAGTGTVVNFLSNIPSYGDVLTLSDNTGFFNYYVFNPGSFAQLGAYGTDWNNNGSLTVAVPEPAAAPLTLAGVVMLAGFASFRRKLVAGNLAA